MKPARAFTTLARSALVAVGVLAAAHSSARADWNTRVTIGPPASDPDIRMAPDAIDGTFVVWRGPRDSGTGTQVNIEHVDEYGSLKWHAIVYSGPETYNPRGPVTQIVGDDGIDVCSDGAGGAIVAWTQGDASTNSQDVLASRYNSSGTRVWGPDSVCNTPGSNQVLRGIVADGSGGAVFCWDDHRNTSGLHEWQLYATRFKGSPPTVTWATNGMLISSLTDLLDDDDMTPANFRPVRGTADDFYFTYVERDAGGITHVRAQRVDTFANPKFAAPGLALLDGTAADGQPDQVSSFADGSGGFIAAAQNEYTVNAMQVIVTGAQPWGVGGHTVAHAALDLFTNLQAVSDGAGGVIVVGARTLGTEPVIALRIDSSGGAPWGASGITVTPATNLLYQQSTAVVPDGVGGVMVAYAVPTGAPTQYQIFTQGLDSGGHRAFAGTGPVIAPLRTNSAGPPILAGCTAPFGYALYASGDDLGLDAMQVMMPDLDATYLPTGWTYPIVPRLDATATFGSCHPTALLDIDPVYLNWVVTQIGPNNVPGIQTRVYLDFHSATDYANYWGENWSEPVTPGYLPMLNFNVGTWPAGLHTLTLFADPNLNGGDYHVDQFYLTNDTWSRQYTVYPHWIVPPPPLKNVFTVFKPPPWAGNGTLPNGWGYEFPTPAVGPGTPNAWVLSTASKRGPTYDVNTGGLLSPGDDYSIMAFNDPAGAGPFVNVIGSSRQPYNKTDFLIAAAPAITDTIFPLVFRDSIPDASPDSGYYNASFGDGHVGLASGSSWLGQTMAPGELAHVFILNALARQQLHLSLRVHGGISGYPPSPCKFEVFPPTGAVFARGGGMGSQMTSAQVETLTFVATQNGPYLVAVFRDDGSQAESPLTYDFLSSTAGTLDAPDAAHRELAFAGAEPNPVTDGTTLAFTLPDRADTRLEIYDVGGRRVRSLVAGIEDAGDHHVRWDGRGENGAALGAGLYWARLEFAGHSITRRMTMLR